MSFCKVAHNVPPLADSGVILTRNIQIYKKFPLAENFPKQTQTSHCCKRLLLVVAPSFIITQHNHKHFPVSFFHFHFDANKFRNVFCANYSSVICNATFSATNSTQHFQQPFRFAFKFQFLFFHGIGKKT